MSVYPSIWLSARLYVRAWLPICICLPVHRYELNFFLDLVLLIQCKIINKCSYIIIVHFTWMFWLSLFLTLFKRFLFFFLVPSSIYNSSYELDVLNAKIYRLNIYVFTMDIVHFIAPVCFNYHEYTLYAKQLAWLTLQ